MTQVGYKLSSEEHRPSDLVAFAARAEQAGFDFAMISDHYHPWIDRQGHSPFVWAVLGGIAQATSRLRVGTGVTCPSMRIHPAIVAHAAATAACMLPGRFMLGLGSGENLNEHVLGGAWPSAAVRQEMLAEAIEVIRTLWQGDMHSHRGRYFTVENARIYDLPAEPPPLLVAAGGPKAAELAGKAGDGLIGLAPQRELLDRFERAGGKGKPTYAEINVCWAADDASARRTAFERWPNPAIEGDLSAELPLPQHFEQAARMVTEDAVAEKVAHGPDPEPYLAMIQKYVDAGYSHVWLHQIGPDQEGFFRFFERELRSKLR